MELLMPNEVRILVNTSSENDKQYKKFMDMIKEKKNELLSKNVAVFPNLAGGDTTFSIDVYNNAGQKVLMLHDVNEETVGTIMETVNGMKGGYKDPYYEKYLKYKRKYLRLLNA